MGWVEGSLIIMDKAAMCESIIGSRSLGTLEILAVLHNHIGPDTLYHDDDDLKICLSTVGAQPRNP